MKLSSNKNTLSCLNICFTCYDKPELRYIDTYSFTSYKRSVHLDTYSFICYLRPVHLDTYSFTYCIRPEIRQICYPSILEASGYVYFTLTSGRCFGSLLYYRIPNYYNCEPDIKPMLYLLQVSVIRCYVLRCRNTTHCELL